MNPFLTDVFQSKLPCAQFLLRKQVFSNYRTKSCAIDTDAGCAKRIITETTKKHSSVSPRKWHRPCSLLLIFNYSVRLHLLLFVQVCRMIGIVLERLNSNLRMNMWIGFRQSHRIKFRSLHSQRSDKECTNFTKIYELLPISRRQKDKKEISFLRTTNVSRHRKIFSRPGNLAPVMCAVLIQTM